MLKRPDHAAAIIAEDIVPAQVRQTVAAIDVAAGDGTVTAAVVILENRKGQVLASTSTVFVIAFILVPTIIFAPGVMDRRKVDFLIVVLAYVRDVQVARRLVEAEPPRVAQSLGPQFGTCGGIASKRVAGWDAIRIAVIHIQA